MEFKLLKIFPDELQGEWNALLENSVTHVPFMRYEYQKTWWETRGGGEWKNIDLFIVVAYQDGELCGIAPLFYTNDHGGDPSLMLVGSIEVSDYLDLIARPEDLEEFVDGLLPFLEGSVFPAWNKIDLYNILDGSPTIKSLEAATNRQGWTFNLDRLQHSPYIPLPGDWETYLAGIDKKQRHEVRRKIRRLEESEAQSRWYIVEDRDSLDREIAEFLEMMVLDPKKAEFLTPEMKDHMYRTVHCAFDQGCLCLAFLEINGEKAAGKLCFDYLDRIWAYNSGVNRKFNEYSPGWVLLGYLLQWANEKKYHEVDMMRGDEDYKYRFGGIDRFVMRATISR